MSNATKRRRQAKPAKDELLRGVAAVVERRQQLAAQPARDDQLALIWPPWNALPAEMLPGTLPFNGVEFQLAPAGTGKANAVVAKGQKIDLPAGKFNRIYVLAAAVDGDQKAEFRAGDRASEITV